MILAQAIRVLVLSGVAFIAALLFTPFWERILKRYAFGKQIRTSEEAPVFSALHEKKKGTPTGGGVIIWGTVVFMAFVFWLGNIFFDGVFKYFNFISRPETYLPLTALLIAALVGFADDWLGILKIGGAKGGGIKVRHKLILYAVLAAVGAWWFFYRLGWDVLAIPFMHNLQVGAWYIPIFMFVIIASAFSANETDGLDGLLGGTSLFGFLSLLVVAFVLKRYDLAAFCGAMAGSLLAFLWFNIYPARFFMGDTGSMALGITLGVTAMLTNTVLLLPFFMLIPVIESLSVIVQLTSKKLRGKKIFMSTPIHHHFEAIGWPESQVTMRFWIVSAISCAFGLVAFFLARL